LRKLRLIAELTRGVYSTCRIRLLHPLIIGGRLSCGGAWWAAWASGRR
jgi:hypothetical protein